MSPPLKMFAGRLRHLLTSPDYAKIEATNSRIMLVKSIDDEGSNCGLLIENQPGFTVVQRS